MTRAPAGHRKDVMRRNTSFGKGSPKKMMCLTVTYSKMLDMRWGEPQTPMLPRGPSETSASRRVLRVVGKLRPWLWVAGASPRGVGFTPQ